MMLKDKCKSFSSFFAYKNIKFSISDNFNIKNIAKISSNSSIFTNQNNHPNTIQSFKDKMTKNFFQNSIKITKLKNKINATNYEFFEYLNENHSEEIEIQTRKLNLNKNNRRKPIITNNFLLTSFFCNDSKMTKILIEYLKLDLEHEPFLYNSHKENYSYLNNFWKSKENEEDKEENFSSKLDCLNLNLIFDITFAADTTNKRNFSYCKIKDSFIFLIAQDQIIIFALCDIMQLNVNLNCFRFDFYENFNSDKRLFFINKNIRDIPQAYNWPFISGFKPILKSKSNNKDDYYIEKCFVFLYYNCKNIYFYLVII